MSARIDAAMRRENISQTDLAQRLNISPQAVQQWTSGKTTPRGKRLIELARVLKVEVSWLLTGTSTESVQGVSTQQSHDQWIKENTKSVRIIEWDNADDLPPDKYALVPRFELKLSAGNGVLITEEMPGEPLAFTTEWLKQKGVKRRNLAVVNAVGDSMEPSINCGNILLVDTGSTDVMDGKVYAIRYGDQLRFKRLYRRYDGGIIIRSDNKAKYADENLSPDDMNEHIYVIGRVIWQAGDL